MSKIILHPRNKLNFYSTDQLLKEIEGHKPKLKTLSHYSDFELERIITLICNRIRFINVKLISKEAFLLAESLTRDIDIDDTEFVALTEHLKGKLWSGDLSLQRGLKSKGWKRFITTSELIELIGK
jgi:predicted nucleic acid-binding protein